MPYTANEAACGQLCRARLNIFPPDIVFGFSFAGHCYSRRADSQKGRRIQCVCLSVRAAIHFLCHVEYWCGAGTRRSCKDGRIHQTELWIEFAFYSWRIKRHHLWVPCQRCRWVLPDSFAERFRRLQDGRAWLLYQRIHLSHVGYI